MSGLVTIAVLVAALAHAGWNAMVKGKGGTGDPLASSVGLCAVWAIIGVPLVVWLPLPEPASWGAIAASVAIHEVYICVLVVAYRGADLSLVYPIARGLPPMMLLFGATVFLDERPSMLGVGGVSLVVVGVALLGWPGQRAVPRRSLLLALLMAICTASYTLVDGSGVRLSGHAISYAVWLTALQGSIFAVGALLVGGRALRGEVWRRRHVSLVAGVLSAGAYTIALWAMAQAPVALVAALRETSIVFAAFFGATFLGEPFGRRRVAAAAVVAAGVVAIRLA